MFLGDFPEDFTTVTCMFTTHASTGAPVAPNSAFEAADVIIYKNGNGAQKTTTNGVTMTSPFDSITGLHCVVLDTSNDTGDASFWVAGAQYTLVLSPDETVDGVAVAKVIGTFGIELAEVLRPTTAGRQLDVSAGGEAGIDWANIGSPTTAVNLSATNIDVDQVVASVSGAVGSVTGLTAADVAAIKAKTDNLPSDPADASVVAGLIAGVETKVDAIDLVVDAILVDTAEIGAAGAGLTNINLPNQTMDIVGNITGNLSGSVGSVTGLTAANLDTTISSRASAADLATVAGYIDTEITTIISAIGTIDGIVDNIVGVTEKLDDTLVDAGGGNWVFTEAALENAPSSGGTAPTAVEIADEVTTRTLDANVVKVNDVTVIGNGTPGNEWGPA